MARQILLLCVLLVSGCAVSVSEDTHVQSNETLEQWSHSAEADRGYIVLSSSVSAQMALDAVKKIIALDSDPNVQRITMIINSNGGEAGALRTIYNAMRLSHKPVDTMNIGNCYSAACAIFAGATGTRYACKDSHFMVHSPKLVSGSERKYEDVLNFEVSFFEKAIRAHSHLPEAWFPLTSKQRFFSAQEALQYGFVDELIETFPAR
jgi:ATP-dependent Clp protease, protease subunit